MNTSRWFAVLGCVLVAGIIMELFTIARAPVGYQDEAGFHPGAPLPGSDNVSYE